MTAHRAITQSIDHLPDGPETAAIFDFDGTIIAGYSAFILIKEQLKKRQLSLTDLYKILTALTNYKLQLCDFTELLSVGSEVIQGKSEEDYLAFCKSLYEKHIARQIYPEARALIRAHLKKGHTVSIISSAPIYQVQFAAQDLGIEHVYCSQFDIVEGKFTGKITSPPCWGQGKVDAALSLAESQNVDLSKSVFYTDSEDDIALVNHIGFPVAINPTDVLEKRCLEQDIPIHRFSSRKPPSLIQYIRSIGVYTSLVSTWLGGLSVAKMTRSPEEGRNFMVATFADVACALAGLKLNIKGKEHLVPERPCVVIFNHQSQADGIIIMKLLKNSFAGIGKDSLVKFPLIGDAYVYAGIVPIDRANSQSAIEAMQPLVDVIKNDGRSVALAPEGTRSIGTKPGTFKKGAFHIAMQAGVPVLPIVIHNGIDAQPKGEFIYRSSEIDIEILPPVSSDDWTKESLNKVVNDVRNQFLTALGYAEEPLTAATSTPSSANAKGTV